MDKQDKDYIIGCAIVVGGIIGTLFSICFLWMIVSSAYAKYHLWEQSLAGQAELKRAEWTRQIAVKEALAKKDSSTLLAQAEVERAKGVALANKIIGDSLHNNEDYLRYLWIDSLQHTANQIIYVPTETNLPILEASRNFKGGK
jgi:hypothetical protein